MTVHASTVAWALSDGAFAIVLAGRSGSGKSSLALELMALGAQLISDDQTCLHPEGGKLIATAPAALKGMIEWRGVGLLPSHALDRAQVVAWVDLDSPSTVRLPEPKWKTVFGLRLPCLCVPPAGPVAAGLRHYIMFRAWRTHGDT